MAHLLDILSSMQFKRFTWTQSGYNRRTYHCRPKKVQSETAEWVSTRCSMESQQQDVLAAFTKAPPNSNSFVSLLCFYCGTLSEYLQ